MNILASLTNKEGSEKFLHRIMDHVNVIYASAGTRKYLDDNGVKCSGIDSLTGFTELLGGRVKTLHPAIFAGILARDIESDMKQIAEQGFIAFDIVMCNLYDFESHRNGTLEEMVENIDIGGVSLIRAAAKNFSRVTVISDPADYNMVAESIEKHGHVEDDIRRGLALKAFSLTSRYDSLIERSLSGNYREMERTDIFIPSAGKKLRYGENPDQEGFIYEIDRYGKLEVFHGKEMSYNNYMDASSAIETVLEFDEPFAVVIKHNTPCGAATGEDHSNALTKAMDSDRESAYGSVICINGTVTVPVVESMKGIFVEMLIGKEFTPEAREMLEKKKNIRLAIYSGKGPSSKIRTVFNGFLEQNVVPAMPEKIGDVVNRNDQLLHDMIFAWKIVAHCRSNAIVLAKNGATVGIGAGQTSRVQAARIAVERAGERAEGSVMASDAYLPFADNVDVAAASGITGIIEPGGSIRDQDVIDACTKHGISLYFTGKRVFLH